MGLSVAFLILKSQCGSNQVFLTCIWEKNL